MKYMFYYIKKYMYFNFKNRYFGSIHFNIYKEKDVQLKKNSRSPVQNE